MAIRIQFFVRLLRHSVLPALCFMMPGILSPHTAHAQDWRFEPVVKVGGAYDDNATLNIRTDQEVALKGYLLDLRADFKYASEGTTFLLEPRALINTYPDEPDFESEDYFLLSRFSHRGQLSTIGFRANFDHQSVRTAERSNSDLGIEDPGDITGDDTGRVLLFGMRDKWRFAPFWTYRVSDISTIGANLDYFDVQYDDTVAGILTDYSDARLNLNYRRTFSNLNTGLLTLTGRSYDSGRVSGDITGYGAMVGIEHALSPKTNITTLIGMEDTTQTNLESDPEVVGSVTLTRQLETINMFAQYRRAINASGASALSVRDSFNLNFTRRLNQKITAGLGVRAYQSSDLSGSVLVNDRNYVQLQSSFLWYLSTAFVIEASYRYTVNDRSATIGERANANQINLWFVYQPKTIPRI